MQRETGHSTNVADSGLIEDKLRVPVLPRTRSNTVDDPKCDENNVKDDSGEYSLSHPAPPSREIEQLARQNFASIPRSPLKSPSSSSMVASPPTACFSDASRDLLSGLRPSLTAYGNTSNQPVAHQPVAIELCTPPASVASLDLKKEFLIAMSPTCDVVPLAADDTRLRRSSDYAQDRPHDVITSLRSHTDIPRDINEPVNLSLLDDSNFPQAPGLMSLGHGGKSSNNTNPAGGSQHDASLPLDNMVRSQSQAPPTSIQISGVDVQSSIMSQVTEADMSCPPPSFGHDVDSHVNNDRKDDRVVSADSNPSLGDCVYPHRQHWPPHLPVCAVTADEFERFVTDHLSVTAEADMHEQKVNALAIVRNLLDSLAGLCQQLPLKISTRLFTLFSRQHFLDALVHLLADKSDSKAVTSTYLSSPTYTKLQSLPANAPVSRKDFHRNLPLPSLQHPNTTHAKSECDCRSALKQHSCEHELRSQLEPTSHMVSVASPTALLRAKQEYDARRSYTYPFLVARILAYGSQDLRLSVLSSPTAIPRTTALLCDKHVDPLVAGHVVTVLESFLEFSPLPVLQCFADVPHFVECLVSNLHLSPVASLLVSIIPPPSNPQGLSFTNAVTPHLACALRVLSTSRVLSLLAEAFIGSARNVMRGAHGDVGSELWYDDTKRVENAAEAIANLMSRLTPVLRIHQNAAIEVVGAFGAGVDLSASERLVTLASSDLSAALHEMSTEKSLSGEQLRNFRLDCAAVDIFENRTACQALESMFHCSFQVLQESNYQCAEPLHAVVDCNVKLLNTLHACRTQRLHCLAQETPPLRSSAFESQVLSLFHPLINVLVETAEVDRGFAACRIKIFDLFVAAQRACKPEPLYAMMEEVRFAEVSLKFLRLRKRNSLLHSIIASSVETALLSDEATETSRALWLRQARLVDRIVATWTAEGGMSVWTDSFASQQVPYLSSIIHMACCVQHLRVMDEKCLVDLVCQDTLNAFDAFCDGPLKAILQIETKRLGGAHPPRRRKDRALHPTSSSPFESSPSSLRRTSSLTSFPSSTVQRSARSLVRSPSAHRFGYVQPVRTENVKRTSRLSSLFSSETSVDFNDSTCKGKIDLLSRTDENGEQASSLAAAGEDSRFSRFASPDIRQNCNTGCGFRGDGDDMEMDDFECDDDGDDFGAIQKSSLL